MDNAGSVDEAKVIVDRVMRDAVAGYAVIDLEGVILTSNQAFCTMLGRDMQSFHGTDFKQYFLQSYRQLAADWLTGVQSGADVSLRQLSGLLHADGSTRMIDLNASINRNDEGLPTCVVLAAWDITEILSRWSRTKDAKNMLELALTVNKIGTWEHVPDTDEFALDETAEALFGYAKGTYPKRSFTEHLQHHMPIALDEKLREALSAFTHPHEGNKDSSLSVKVRLIRQAGGTASWMRIGERVIDHPVVFGAKKVIGTVQDVNTQVKAFIKLLETQRALKRNTQLVDAATDASGIGIWRVVPANQECWYSDSWFRALGYQPDELPHNFDMFTSLLHPDDVDPVFANLEKTINSATDQFHADFRLRRKDGSYAWFGSAGMKIADEDVEGGVAIVGAQIDISERVEAKDRVEAAAVLARTTFERLKRLTENVPGAIFEFKIDPEGHVSFPYFTSGLPKLLGISAEILKQDANLAYVNVHIEDRLRIHTEVQKSAKELGEFKIVYRLIHPQHGLLWLRASSTPIALPEGGIVWHGSMFDVTKEMHREKELEDAKQRTEQQSLHDPLTQLPNRRAFDAAMQERYQDARLKSKRHTIIRIDLDHFKFVNDSLGHAAGDAVLVHMARILRNNIRETDLAARVGGDEFVILMSAGQTTDDAMEVIKRVHNAVRQPFMYEGRHCRFDSSFGVASSASLPDDPDELLSFADTALYEAKRAGRGRVMTFTPALHAEIQRIRKRSDQIQFGLERGEFVPYFQPQVDAQTGTISGCEVLARWNHPEEGLISPDEFIPVAEQIRVVQDIDRAVFLQALDTLERLRVVNLALPKMSFNVSVGRILDPDIIRSVRSLQTNGTRVAFELLESILLEEEGAVFEHHLDLLKECGVDIEVDDFGSGRASIIGVMRVAPNTIKIDRRLIQPMVQDETVCGLV